MGLTDHLSLKYLYHVQGCTLTCLQPDQTESGPIATGTFVISGSTVLPGLASIGIRGCHSSYILSSGSQIDYGSTPVQLLQCHFRV